MPRERLLSIRLAADAGEVAKLAPFVGCPNSSAAIADAWAANGPQGHQNGNRGEALARAPSPKGVWDWSGAARRGATDDPAAAPGRPSPRNASKRRRGERRGQTRVPAGERRV